MSENPDEVWTRVDEELTRRAESRQVPSSWAELARRLETTEQRLNNWKRRGVPARSYVEIADVLGWTVDQVAGRADIPRQVGVSLDVALGVLRDHLAPLDRAFSMEAADALRNLALMPDSERAFQNVLSALNPTARHISPLESGAVLPLAHALSPPPAQTRRADPQVLGGSNQPEGGEEWMHTGRRIGPNIKPINRTTGQSKKPGKEKNK